MRAGLRLGLVFGGRSVEHEVSVISARGVSRALRETEIACVALAVTGDGRWLSPELSEQILHSEAGRVDPEPERDDAVRLLIDPGGKGILRHAPGPATSRVEVDVVFPLIHGWGGEDGRLQGALELAGIPYVGAGVLGSAAGMDKAVAKHVMQAHGLAVAPWRLVTRDEYEDRPGQTELALGEEIGFPLFAKPANGGSSVGISKVAEPGGLRAALQLALVHDRRAVIEQALDARELECAVIGNERPEASGLGEIIPQREFYDYEAKYLEDSSRLEIPADIDGGLAEEMRGQAVAAYRALDLAGFARVDFLLERQGSRPYLNEVNTLPGFTPISMFPKLWEAAGLPYPRLIERLVQLALERGRTDAERTTRRAADRLTG